LNNTFDALRLNRFALPNGVTYEGSFNAWWSYSIKKWINSKEPEKKTIKEAISPLWIIIVFVFPFLASLPLLFGMIIVIFGAGLLVLILIILAALVFSIFCCRFPTLDDIMMLNEELFI